MSQPITSATVLASIAAKYDLLGDLLEQEKQKVQAIDNEIIQLSLSQENS